MSQEEKEEYKKKLEDDKKQKQVDVKLNLKKKKDEAKKEFKKLSKEEQLKIIEANKKQKHIEFPYLEELNDTQLEKLGTTNKVYVDPGKRCLLYMMDDKGKYLKYTNRKHMKRTKRLKYQRYIVNYKKKTRNN